MDILTFENNSYCSERVSPRRLRGNEILPPECHYVLQSYCTQRISPRRQRNGCEEFTEDVLLSNIKTSLTDPLTTSSTTSSSPILVPSSFTSQIIQQEETLENQEVFENQGISEDQGVSVSQIPQIDDQSSSENISEASQVESSEPSSSSTKIKIEDPLKSPFPFRDRVDSSDVTLRIYNFGDEMLKIESIEPHVPQRNIAIDIFNITACFENIMKKGFFEEEDQKDLLKYLDHLTESTTEVLQKNIDIKEIKRKTIEVYKDAARLILESIESDPHHRPITIQTTGDLQAVLDKARQLSNDLKTVPRNVSKQPMTSKVSVIDETQETSGTTAEDIEEMIKAIFNAFDTLVYREQNKNE